MSVSFLKNTFCLFLLGLLACKEPIPPAPVLYGEVSGLLLFGNEYGLYAGFEEPGIVSLYTEDGDLLERSHQKPGFSRFNFDSIPLGNYYLEADAESFKNCTQYPFTFTPRERSFHYEIPLNRTEFEAKLLDVRLDSLVGNHLYHSFDIDKLTDGTLQVWFYLGNTPSVDHLNYVEKGQNLAAWPAERSGQYRKYITIDRDRYTGDRIYATVYLVANNATECIGPYGFPYHYPFGENRITVSIPK